MPVCAGGALERGTGFTVTTPHSAAYLHTRNRITLSLPGAPALFTGIYRCSICLQEVPSVQGYPLPTHLEHMHSKGIDTMWRLIVSHDDGESNLAPPTARPVQVEVSVRDLWK